MILIPMFLEITNNISMNTYISFTFRISALYLPQDSGVSYYEEQWVRDGSTDTFGLELIKTGL